MARSGSNVSIYIGIVVSVALALQLTNHIMFSGVGSEISFIEFVSIPENILYILMRVCLCMAFWIMNGANNRTYLICWFFGDIVSSLIFWNGFNLYFHDDKNIYVLNLLGLVSIIPLYLFCRYRILIMCYLFSGLHKLTLFKGWTLRQQKKLKITKTTTHLDRWLTLFVLIEIVFAALFTFFSLYFGLSPQESLNQQLSRGDWPNFFAYHSVALYIWTIGSCILLIKLAIEDRHDPDAFIPVTASVKKRVIDKFKK